VANYIERALDSALAQTMPDLEVIVVDDASEDATLEVGHRIAARDARVRVLQNKHNSGPSASRNRAISVARGEWIALLDGDDAWLPERLERMLAYSDNADLITDDVYLVHKSFTKPAEYVFWSLLQEHGLTIKEPRRLSSLDFVRYDLGPVKPIIRRSFVERHQIAYDPAVRHGEDFLFFFEALASKARWLQLPHGYYLWTSGRPGSLSSDHRVLWQGIIENLQPLLDHPSVVRDVSLATALERFVQKANDILAVGRLREMIRHRRFTEITQLLLKQPSLFFLIMKACIRRIRLRRLLVRRYRFVELEAFHAPGRRVG
jgi:glycosyltransferase involved in cell wall biosynthesis